MDSKYEKELLEAAGKKALFEEWMIDPSTKSFIEMISSLKEKAVEHLSKEIEIEKIYKLTGEITAYINLLKLPKYIIDKGLDAEKLLSGEKNGR